MSRKSRAITKEHILRFAKLREIGCIACLLDESEYQCGPVEIHHLLSGTSRIGHDATIPLGKWHHQGLPFDGVPESWLLANVGPSYHKHRRAFRQRYGSDREILDTVNGMIEG